MKLKVSRNSKSDLAQLHTNLNRCITGGSYKKQKEQRV